MYDVCWDCSAGDCYSENHHSCIPRPWGLYLVSVSHPHDVPPPLPPTTHKYRYHSHFQGTNDQEHNNYPDGEDELVASLKQKGCQFWIPSQESIKSAVTTRHLQEKLHQVLSVWPRATMYIYYIYVTYYVLCIQKALRAWHSAIFQMPNQSSPPTPRLTVGNAHVVPRSRQ